MKIYFYLLRPTVDPLTDVVVTDVKTFDVAKMITKDIISVDFLSKCAFEAFVLSLVNAGRADDITIRMPWTHFDQAMYAEFVRLSIIYTGLLPTPKMTRIAFTLTPDDDLPSALPLELDSIMTPEHRLSSIFSNIDICRSKKAKADVKLEAAVALERNGVRWNQLPKAPLRDLGLTSVDVGVDVVTSDTVVQCKHYHDTSGVNLSSANKLASLATLLCKKPSFVVTNDSGPTTHSQRIVDAHAMEVTCVGVDVDGYVNRVLAMDHVAVNVTKYDNAKKESAKPYEKMMPFQKLVHDFVIDEMKTPSTSKTVANWKQLVDAAITVEAPTGAGKSIMLSEVVHTVRAAATGGGITVIVVPTIEVVEVLYDAVVAVSEVHKDNVMKAVKLHSGEGGQREFDDEKFNVIVTTYASLQLLPADVRNRVDDFHVDEADALRNVIVPVIASKDDEGDGDDDSDDGETFELTDVTDTSRQVFQQLVNGGKANVTLWSATLRVPLGTNRHYTLSASAMRAAKKLDLAVDTAVTLVSGCTSYIPAIVYTVKQYVETREIPLVLARSVEDAQLLSLVLREDKRMTVAEMHSGAVKDDEHRRQMKALNDAGQSYDTLPDVVVTVDAGVRGVNMCNVSGLVLCGYNGVATLVQAMGRLMRPVIGVGAKHVSVNLLLMSNDDVTNGRAMVNYTQALALQGIDDDKPVVTAVTVTLPAASTAKKMKTKKRKRGGVDDDKKQEGVRDAVVTAMRADLLGFDAAQQLTTVTLANLVDGCIGEIKLPTMALSMSYKVSLLNDLFLKKEKEVGVTDYVVRVEDKECLDIHVGGSKTIKFNIGALMRSIKGCTTHAELKSSILANADLYSKSFIFNLTSGKGDVGLHNTLLWVKIIGKGTLPINQWSTRNKKASDRTFHEQWQLSSNENIKSMYLARYPSRNTVPPDLMSIPEFVAKYNAARTKFDVGGVIVTNAEYKMSKKKTTSKRKKTTK
jgi:superfamily II DNA or RNA helicase